MKKFIEDNQPVVSVDTKKKEMLGNFLNAGQEWRPKGEARRVLDHDFPLKDGKTCPYGIYDVAKNSGFINLGQSADTSRFAVESLRRWWYRVGRFQYQGATKLLIMCDGSGSNSWRRHMWKFELAKFAEETGLEIWVSHYPPGTSKHNPIEHRLFSQISMNWR